jgi:hypothetical protein
MAIFNSSVSLPEGIPLNISRSWFPSLPIPGHGAGKRRSLDPGGTTATAWLFSEGTYGRNARGFTRPGKRLHSYGKIHHFLMGKLTISMVISNSYVSHYQRIG